MDIDELNLEQLLHNVQLIDVYLLIQNDNVDQLVVLINVEEILQEKVNVQLLKIIIYKKNRLFKRIYFLHSSLSSNKHQTR